MIGAQPPRSTLRESPPPGLQSLGLATGANVSPYRLNSGGAGSKARAQAQQVSLIDFDDDEAFAAPTPPAASTPAVPNAAPSNPLDDLASLSLGGSSSAGPPPQPQQQQQRGNGAGSLFDLNEAFAAPAPGGQAPPTYSMPSQASFNGSPAPSAPMGSRPPSQPVSGTFFSQQARYGGSPGSSTRPSASPSPAPSPSVSTFGGGSAAGLGSISLGGGAPPVPPKQQQQQQKDAFADLLGDF